MKNLLAAIGAAVLFTIPLLLGATDSVTTYFRDHSPTGLNIAILLLVGPVSMITAVTIELMVLVTSCRVLLNRRPWVTHRNAFIAALAISVSVVVYFFGRVAFNLLT